MPEPMVTVDRPAAVSGGKMVDLGTEPQIASAATLMASIGRLSGLVGRIEQAQAKGKWPGVRLSGVTSDTQHSQTSRDPVRLLMVSAANSTEVPSRSTPTARGCVVRTGRAGFCDTAGTKQIPDPADGTVYRTTRLNRAIVLERRI